MDRPEIIRIIAEDNRFHNQIQSWQFGYMNFETLLSIVIKTWHLDKVNQSFVDEAQRIIDDSEWRF